MPTPGTGGKDYYAWAGVEYHPFESDVSAGTPPKARSDYERGYQAGYHSGMRERAATPSPEGLADVAAGRVKPWSEVRARLLAPSAEPPGRMSRFVKKLPLVEVIWDDCLLFTGGWEAHAAVMRQRRRIRQRSVGYILADDKKGIVLAAALSQGGNVFGAHVIPAAQIVSRRKLR